MGEYITVDRTVTIVLPLMKQMKKNHPGASSVKKEEGHYVFSSYIVGCDAMEESISHIYNYSDVSPVCIRLMKLIVASYTIANLL